MPVVCDWQRNCELHRLQKIYGKGRWGKRKGIAELKLPDGTIRMAELHCYEANGIGKKEYRIKRYLELNP